MNSHFRRLSVALRIPLVDSLNCYTISHIWPLNATTLNPGKSSNIGCFARCASLMATARVDVNTHMCQEGENYNMASAWPGPPDVDPHSRNDMTVPDLYANGGRGSRTLAPPRPPEPVAESRPAESSGRSSGR